MTVHEQAAALQVLCGRLLASGGVCCPGDQLDRLAPWFYATGLLVPALATVHRLIVRLQEAQGPREIAVCLLDLNLAARQLAGLLARTDSELIA